VVFLSLFSTNLSLTLSLALVLSMLKLWILNLLFYQLLYGILKVLFLDLFFSIYIPLPLVLSSLNHVFISIATLMMYSFSFASPHSNFLSTFLFLRNIRTEVYFWMSVNLLKFNPFKTDFMLFGLLKQLFKAQAALSIGLVKCGSWFCKWGLSLSTIWQLILLRQSRTRAHMV
jgi:hypothetical protein